jgi:hypothetical protein
MAMTFNSIATETGTVVPSCVTSTGCLSPIGSTGPFCCCRLIGIRFYRYLNIGTSGNQDKKQKKPQVLKLFMKWTGDIKPRNIELPEDLHAEIKSVAAKRGTTLKGAYQEALEQWLEPEAHADLGLAATIGESVLAWLCDPSTEEYESAYYAKKFGIDPSIIESQKAEFLRRKKRGS